MLEINLLGTSPFPFFLVKSWLYCPIIPQWTQTIPVVNFVIFFLVPGFGIVFFFCNKVKSVQMKKNFIDPQKKQRQGQNRVKLKFHV